MYKAIIIDDEAKLRHVLEMKISKYCPEIVVVGLAANMELAESLITQHRPHLIFLDIEMPNGSGFDLLEKLDTVNFEVIFVTGYNEFAIEAVKVDAVDYLLKPVITEDLVKAVDKAINRIKRSSIIENFELLKHNINNLGDQSSKIGIPNNKTYEFVQVSDIIRCEGWQRYTKVYLVTGNVLTSSYNIGVFRDLLKDYGFYESHKSHLINKKHILRYHKEGILGMSDGSEVPVARRRKEFFLQVVLADKVIK